MTPPSGLPSFRWLQVLAFAPIASAALATALTGISIVTATAAILGALVPMVVAKTFWISLDIQPDRSPLQARFGFLWDKLPPNRLQRWYVPLVGAAAAGAAAELSRLVISFARAGAQLSLDVIAMAGAVGALEGLFLALALVFGFGIGSVSLTFRIRRGLG